MTDFEDHLWSHLVSEHRADQATAMRPARPRRRRTPRLVGGSVAGLAAAAAVVTVALTATSATAPAFAVTDNHDGTATITLREITAIGPLNARLAQLGIRAQAVPVIAGCKAKEQLPLAYSNWKTSLDYTVTIGNRWLDPGYTGVMAVKQQPSGAIEATFASVPTALVPNCVPATVLPVVPVPSG